MTLRHNATFDSSKRGTDPDSGQFGGLSKLPDMGEPFAFDDPLLSPTDGGDGVRELLSTILKRKWLVFLCIAVGIGIAAKRYVGKPPFFLAMASISMMDDQEKNFYTPSRFTDPSLEYFKTYILARSKTMAQVMNSMAVREAVARYMSDTSSSGHDTVSQSASALSRSTHVPIHPMAVPRASVYAQQKSSLMTVTTQSLQRDVALRSLEGYLSVFREQYQEKKHGDAAKALAWLKDALSKAKEELNKSQQTLQAFRKQHGMPSEASGSDPIRHLANGWMDQLGGNDASETGLDPTSSPPDLEPTSPLLHKRLPPYVANIQSRLTTLQSQYEDMRGIYAPTFPVMVMMKKKISLLQNMLSDLGQQESAALAANAKTREELNRKDRQEAWTEIVRLNAAGPEFRLLKMETETNEKLYDLLFREFKKAEQRVSAAAEDFVIVSPPSVWEIRPTYLKKVAMGGLVGLFSGVLLALALGSMDTRVYSGKDIERHFRCRALGTVPDLSSYRKSPRPKDTGMWDTPEFFAHYDQDSPIFDPIRNIQSSIFLTNTGRSVSCLAVSSALPGEGKTLIAVSLAAVMCLDKTKSVLVIDADLRRPRIHKVFGHSHPGNGLTTLVRKGSVDWSGMVHSSRLPGLYYLMSGPIAHDPVGTLRSETWEAVIESLKDSFDLIVIDTPPLLGFPDAVIASTMVDGTVLVTKEGLVRRNVLSEALRSLTSASGTNLLGVVLNKARPVRKSRFGYFSSCASRYGRYGKYL